MHKLSFFLCLMFLGAAFAYGQKTICLYDGTMPNDNGYTAADEYVGKNGGIYQTSEPRIDLYLPQTNQPAAILLVCPGGGYRYTSVVNEGIHVADFFVPRGIAVAVLKYRLPNGHPEVPLTDALRAMQLLRDSAGEWNLDKHKVGVMGFSAGGHLAATLLTKFESPLTRPDFGVLVYPVISMGNDITHAGSCFQFLGKNLTDGQRHEWSAEHHVTSDTPPCFIVACQDDYTVPVENAIRFYQSLTRQNVVAEMLLLPYGKHGWGFSREFSQRELFEIALIKFIAGCCMR